jgi:hypothetical protein
MLGREVETGAGVPSSPLRKTGATGFPCFSSSESFSDAGVGDSLSLGVLSGP